MGGAPSPRAAPTNTPPTNGTRPRLSPPLTQSAADTADGLQGRELLAVSVVQGFVGVEVFRGQNLRASGAHLTVQLGGRAGPRRRPLVGPVLLVFVPSSDVGLLLRCLEVPVGCEKLLLLANVWQQHQQLVENEVKVVSQQLLAAVVVLGG